MPWTDDLLSGIAQHLADSAGATWKPSGAYVASDPRPVVLYAVPASPDVVIVLTPYGVDDGAGLNDVIEGVQVRTRGTRDSRTMSELNDAVWDALHDLSNVVMNGVPVVLIRRESHSPMGVDGNGRHQYAQNYYVQAARPSTHGTD